MYSNSLIKIGLLASVIIFLSSCSKKDEQTIIPDNNAPDYSNIPTVVLDNYVNRLFIDLLGREPLDAEMAFESNALRDANLNEAARATLISKLQSDTSYVEGDGSYKEAYHGRFYELCKVRFLEGVTDGEILFEKSIIDQNAYVDSLNMDWTSYNENVAKSNVLLGILQSDYQYRYGLINVDEICHRMLLNTIYDDINMNSFNFINAVFDDLFSRYPTSPEFTESYEMVDKDLPGSLFYQQGTNKQDFVDIMINSQEFREGMIVWAFNTLLARNPTTSETFDLLQDFKDDLDFQKVQRKILVTDEYANFPD